MGRPRKNKILQELAQEAVVEQKTVAHANRKAQKGIKLRPIRFYELLITNEDYSFESHLFDEGGVEYVAKTQTKKGGEK